MSPATTTSSDIQHPPSDIGHLPLVLVAGLLLRSRPQRFEGPKIFFVSSRLSGRITSEVAATKVQRHKVWQTKKTNLTEQSSSSNDRCLPPRQLLRTSNIRHPPSDT